MIPSLNFRIKEERKRLGFKKQADIASACGVARETWSRYESGKTEPKIENLFAMAQMGMDVNYILMGQSQNRTITTREQKLLSLWHISSPQVQNKALRVLMSDGEIGGAAFIQTYHGDNVSIDNRQKHTTVGDVSIDGDLNSAFVVTDLEDKE